MRNLSKRMGQHFFKILMLLLLAAPGFAAYSLPANAREIKCKPQGDVTITGKTSSSISFEWDAVDGVDGYRVRYVRQQDNSSGASVTSNTHATLSNLQPGLYTFYIDSYSGGAYSDYIILVDIWI